MARAIRRSGQPGGRRVVLSSHNFDGMTRDLAEQLRDMRGATTGIAQDRGHAAAV
jgi:hypothetical protein